MALPPHCSCMMIKLDLSDFLLQPECGKYLYLQHMDAGINRSGSIRYPQTLPKPCSHAQVPLVGWRASRWLGRKTLIISMPLNQVGGRLRYTKSSFALSSQGPGEGNVPRLRDGYPVGFKGKSGSRLVDLSRGREGFRRSEFRECHG